MLITRSTATMFAGLISLASPIVAEAQNTAEGAPAVRVAQGVLSGVAAPNKEGVNAYLGVPYAAPPVGTLRWAAPRAAASWDGVRAATKFGDRCVQSTFYVQMRFRSGMSEDCLNLNIWKPATARKVGKLPVMIWVYGGGFIGGDGSEYRYDGANLASAGIIVVTLNYRLGVFGFMAHPDLTKEAGASGNYGLLDQAAAIAWVRDNIAAFGGDPKRITVAGESAGSYSTSVLMASPLTRDLVAGVIGQSGAALELPDRAVTEAEGLRLGKQLGIADLAGLRALPADKLLEGSVKSNIRFAPTVDGRMLVEQPVKTYAAGRQAKVPLLIGTNSEESSAVTLLGTDQPWTTVAYRSGVIRAFGMQADAIQTLYPAAGYSDVVRAATELATDRGLGNLTWRWMNMHRKSGMPTYYYYFDNIRPQPLNQEWRLPIQPQVGALHGSELEYALGTTNFNPAWAYTERDQQLSGTMSGYWVAFVKTGNPNFAGAPTWAPVKSKGDAITRHRIGTTIADEPFAGQMRQVQLSKLLHPDLQE